MPKIEKYNLLESDEFDPENDKHFIEGHEAVYLIQDALRKYQEFDDEEIAEWLYEHDSYFLRSDVERIISNVQADFTEEDEALDEAANHESDAASETSKTAADYRFVFDYPFEDEDFRYKDEEYKSLEDALAAADKYWDAAVNDDDELYLDDGDYVDLSESEYWHDVYHIIKFWLEEHPNYRTDGSLDDSETNENGAIMISMFSIG